MTEEILEQIRQAKSNHSVPQLADAVVSAFQHGKDTSEKDFDRVAGYVDECRDRIKQLEDKIAKLQNPQTPVDTQTQPLPFAQKAPAPLAPGTENSILGAVPPPQAQGIPTPTFNENK